MRSRYHEADRVDGQPQLVPLGPAAGRASRAPRSAARSARSLLRVVDRRQPRGRARGRRGRPRPGRARRSASSTARRRPRRVEARVRRRRRGPGRGTTRRRSAAAGSPASSVGPGEVAERRARRHRVADTAASSAAAGKRRNGDGLQRERIVGSIRSAWSDTSTNTPYAGGSSSDFRRALADSSRSRWASRIRYTRRAASNGRRCRSRRSRRAPSIRMPWPSGSSTKRSGCVRDSIRCGAAVEERGREPVGVAALARPGRAREQIGVGGRGDRGLEQAQRRAAARAGRRRRSQPDRRAHPRGDLLGRARGVDDGDPLGEPARGDGEAVGHAAVEARRPRPRSGRPRRARPAAAAALEHQEHRAVGQKAARSRPGSPRAPRRPRARARTPW